MTHLVANAFISPLPHYEIEAQNKGLWSFNLSDPNLYLIFLRAAWLLFHMLSNIPQYALYGILRKGPWRRPYILNQIITSPKVTAGSYHHSLTMSTFHLFTQQLKISQNKKKPILYFWILYLFAWQTHLHNTNRVPLKRFLISIYKNVWGFVSAKRLGISK